QLQPCCKAEALYDIRFGLARRANHKKTVYSCDAVTFCFTNGMLNLRQRLVLPQPIQYRLRSCLNTECQHAAVGLVHDRELINCGRIDPTFASPAKLQFTFNNAVANVVDTLTIEKKMVIRQINRFITSITQLLHLTQDMLRNGIATYPVKWM